MMWRKSNKITFRIGLSIASLTAYGVYLIYIATLRGPQLTKKICRPRRVVGHEKLWARKNIGSRLVAGHKE